MTKIFYHVQKLKERRRTLTDKKKTGGRLFRFFDFNRGDRPDAIEEDTTPTLKRYFKLLGRRFWKLVSLNLMMLPMVLPLLLIFYVTISADKTPIANHPVFAQLYGANLIDPTPATTTLLDLFGAQKSIAVYNDVSTYVLIGICVIFLAVTWGWQNVGSTYILRSMVRGEPVFLFSDYFYAVRRNLKQGFLLGLIDVIAIFLLVFDFTYFMGMSGSFWIDFCYFAILALVVLYFFMRFYLYLMLVTFDMSLRKIFKNALIFSVLGFKRNIMAMLGIVLITSINVVLFALFAMTPLGIAIPLILPFLYYLAVTSFTSAYAAYPIIDRYMIEPYRHLNDEEEEEEYDEPAEEENQ